MQGPRGVAVHFGILTGTHLYPEVCDVGHGWFPRICHHDGQVVVGLVQILKKAYQGVCICEDKEAPGEVRLLPQETGLVAEHTIKIDRQACV